MATSSSNGGATTTRLEGRLKVFNSLFGFIAADARRRGASASLQEHFQSKADSIGVPQPCLGTVKAWASTGGAPAIEGTNEDLQKVINSAFVWLCNNVGPVDADKILLTAVKATETLPESFDCSPRTFL